MKTPLAILLAGFALGVLGLGCLDLLGRNPRDHSTAGSGDATHNDTRNDTDIAAGGDAKVSNWTFNVTDAGPWGLALCTGVGWFGAWRGRRQVCDAMTDSIESTGCKECKAAIRAKGVKFIDKRVRKRFHGGRR